MEELLLDGRTPIFRCELSPEKFGLSESEAIHQDMPEEFAVCEARKANGGLIVYAKFNGEWKVNPCSTRFLIRVLLENSGIALKPIKN